MALTLQPATLKDASYVMANLNKHDAAEVDCQVAPGTPRHEMGYGLLMAGDNFAVREDGQPIAFFGTMPISCCYLQVWALGTKRMWAATAEISKFMRHEHLPERIEQGFIGMEARSWVGHPTAHKWISRMGGRAHGPPFEFGRNREKFLLFRWTPNEIERIRLKRRRPPA